MPNKDDILLAKALYALEIRKKVRPCNFFKPLPYQQEFFDSLRRNLGVFGGNRSGKSLSGAVKVIKACLDAKRRGKRFEAWAGTWADMSIPIQQKIIWDLLPKDGSLRYAKWTEQRGFANKMVSFGDGVTIRFKTYDQGRESFQGAAKDLIWLDEEPPQDIVNECKARLIDRRGQMIRTMTPLNGVTYTYDEMVINDRQDPETVCWFWDNTLNYHIDQQALDETLGAYSDKEAEVRRKGTFMNLTTGNAYYPFDETLNVIEEGKFYYNPNRLLEISCDFNVDLMSWNVGQEVNGIDYEFDFVELEGNANTQKMCDIIKERYGAHKGGLRFYGDISGSKRTPETSKTNWAIVEENFPGAEIYYQNIKNVKDRVDAGNARLKDSKGRVHAKIARNCKRLLKDMRQVTWEMLTHKGKAGLLTHASDGWTYKMFAKYPLTGKTLSKQW